MSRGNYGQTLFHRIFPATARGPASTTTIDWHLKFKNKKCSIHKLIQHILGSHEINLHALFWPCSSKNHWNNFLLSWICTTMQKISSFPQFILEVWPTLESCEQTSHIHFWPCQSNNFLIIFQFMWTCINMQKIRLFHWFVLGIWLIKKSCNLIGWGHFGPYLRNQNFSKYGICAET